MSCKILQIILLVINIYLGHFFWCFFEIGNSELILFFKKMIITRDVLETIFDSLEFDVREIISILFNSLFKTQPFLVALGETFEIILFIFITFWIFKIFVFSLYTNAINWSLSINCREIKSCWFIDAFDLPIRIKLFWKIVIWIFFAFLKILLWSLSF